MHAGSGWFLATPSGAEWFVLFFVYLVFSPPRRLAAGACPYSDEAAHITALARLAPNSVLTAANLLQSRQGHRPEVAALTRLGIHVAVDTAAGLQEEHM